MNTLLNKKEKESLAALGVLITRPAPQAENLKQALNALGAKTIIFPVIKITPCTEEATFLDSLKYYPRADYLLFTSANAVTIACAAIKNANLNWPPSRPVFAIGQATALALAKQNCISLYPDVYSSEALLNKLKELPLHHKSILIFGGQAPRPLLAEGLRKENAKVIPSPCYKREKLAIALSLAQQQALLDQVTVVICTSVDILNQLLSIFALSQERLFNKMFLLGSARIAKELEERGYPHTPIIADNPDDDSIIAALIHSHKDALHG